MSDSREQAQLRQHLAEMRRGAAGVSHDFALEFRDLDDKISRLGTLTAKDAKYALLDIEDDFTRLAISIDREMRALPGQVKGGLKNVGRGIGDGTTRFAGATRDAFEAAGHRAKEGTRNALAAAAGVKRTPMKKWEYPTEESPPAQ